ncbi:MAG: hypothetical protein OEX02_09870 [Cyclobacteriaceae bacterium]|nr:hypothetical protein [Cyclobacteriaceae bacterium]
MMNKYSFVFTLSFALILVSSCEIKSDKEGKKLTAENSILINFDTLYLENPEYQISGTGNFTLINDSIYYADILQSKVTVYNLKGERFKTPISQGKGPAQVEGIDYVWGNMNFRCIYNNGVIYIFNNNWEFFSRFYLNFSGEDISVADIASNNDFIDHPAVYLPEYMELQPFMVTDSTSLICVTKEHMNQNKFYHKEYYAESFPLAMISMVDGSIIRFLGRKTELLLKYDLLPNFDHTYFTIGRDELYVSHDIDPFIYVYDMHGELITQFEGSGINMTSEYIERTGIEADDFYYTDRVRHGYYAYLYYEQSNGLLFRVYKTGTTEKDAEYKHDVPSRLQIFKDKKIVSDISVPNRFRLIGSSGDYIYADGIIDEKNEQIGVYRIRIGR